MKKLKYLIILITIPTIIFIISDSSFIQRELCACATVNDSVIADLKQINTIISQFAEDHKGKYPSYDKLMYILSEENLTNPVTGEKTVKFMTPNIKIFTGTATGRIHRHKIGYSVSSDRTAYVLKGIGETTIMIKINLLGKSYPAGSIYPVLKLGDTPPYPSPLI